MKMHRTATKNEGTPIPAIQKIRKKEEKAAPIPDLRPIKPIPKDDNGTGCQGASNKEKKQ